MSLFAAIHAFSEKRISWLLLLVCTLALELTALYFQYVMLLAPCVMCVYERVAMLGISFAAIIGLINPKFLILRWLGLLTWGYSAYRGLQLSLEHVGYQFNPSIFATCDIFPQFPSWAPLDKWLPWLFEPMGDCSKIVWQFLTLSMPQWLVVIFSVNLIIFIIIVFAQFTKIKKSNPYLD